MARRARIPIAWHLDDAEYYPLVIGALRHGFTSVVADYSSRPFAQNVELTRKVVEAAHAAGVAVEGELGYVPPHRRAGTASLDRGRHNRGGYPGLLHPPR